MNKTFLLIFIIKCILAVRSSLVDDSGKGRVTINDLVPKKYMQTASNFALEQRSCMSFVAGFDFIETSLTKMMQQYIDIYNDRWNGSKASPQSQNKWSNTPFTDGLQYRIEILAPKSRFGHIEARESKNLKVEVPVKVESRDKDVEFQTEFKVEMTSQFKIVNQKKIEIKDFKCKKENNKCEEIRKEMENGFAAKIMPFEGGKYWD